MSGQDRFNSTQRDDSLAPSSTDDRSLSVTAAGFLSGPATVGDPVPAPQHEPNEDSGAETVITTLPVDDEPSGSPTLPYVKSVRPGDLTTPNAGQHSVAANRDLSIGNPTLPFEPRSARVGERVNVPGYEILGELGRGGMGVVYRAMHQKLQRLVALKMILSGTHASEAGIARFKAEAAAIAQLHHPNFVQVYEIGEHDGCPYFSLELIEGGSLDRRLKESPPTPNGAARIIEQLARAMSFAHEHGIVHRDLKPANVLLAVVAAKASVSRSGSRSSISGSEDHWSRNCEPKITDFGLAKRVDDESSNLTATGAIIGTPNYMSPEQAEGRVRQIGPASDIYSLGAMLYEMLTGRPPFKGSNMMEIIKLVVSQDPVPPRQIEPRLALDLETICLKCLEKDPARRYESAIALADDLRRYLDHEPILARPISTTERAIKWAKRRPMAVALIGVSTIATVGMISVVVWHNVALRERLDAALAEERASRMRMDQAVERERVAEIENAAQKLLEHARVAEAASDWTTARLELSKALTALRSDAKLHSLIGPVEKQLATVEEKLHAVAERRGSQARFEEFGMLRDEAQFLGSLYTGMDVAENLRATREAVLKALAVYDIKPGTGRKQENESDDERLLLDPHLDRTQHRRVVADCFRLLLILAEAESLAGGMQADEREQQLKKALAVLDDALRFGTASRAYHLRRARYLERLGDEQAAVQANAEAQKAAVIDVADHFMIADEFYRRANFEDAVREFEHVLQRQPDDFWAGYLSGLCLLRLNRHAEARTMLTACLSQGREFVWIYLLRGYANGELKAWDAAESDFEKALTLPLDQNSHYVLLVNRGVLRIKQERHEDAITDLKEAVKLKPTEYQAYVNLAQAYRRLMQFDRALEQLDIAIKHDSSHSHLYRLRARLHLERNELKEALADFDNALKHDDGDSALRVDDYVERARLLMRDGKYAAALEGLDAALTLRKEHSLALRLKAESLFHLRQFEDVVAAFDAYLEFGKPLESVYRGRGLAMSELGKYPGAIEDFTKALELKPTSEVQAFRGWMHVMCDALKLAERDFEVAIELNPQNADAFTGRGFVRALSKKSPQALADAEQALALGPRSPRLVYNVARIHALVGRPNERQRVLELISEALALLPENQRQIFWTHQVRNDAALAAIRNDSGFMKIESDVLRKK